MPNRKFNDGQEITFADFNAIPLALSREIYDRVIREMVGRTDNAFFSDSLKVSYSSPTQVNVAAGLGFQFDAAQVSPEPTRRPVYLAAITAVNLTTPDGTNPRIDSICVKADRAAELTGNRKYKDPGTGVVSLQSFTLQEDWMSTLLAVAGTPAGSPVAPATPAGYIKLAQCTIPAVVGMSGSGNVTDFRTLMPVGATAAINTLAFTRLTAGAAVSITQLLTDTDTLLRYGANEYNDLTDLGADPASPAATKQRLYLKNGTMYLKSSGGVLTPVGSGSGGGSGADWWPTAGLAPVDTEEYGNQVFKFAPGNLIESLTLWLKVPSGYIAGRPLEMRIGQYSPSASNTQLLRAVTTLIRKGVDAVSSTTNQYTSTNAALTNTVTDQLRETILDLSTSLGAINAVAIAPGDMIKVVLSRVTDTDTADVRFIPSATEVKFG